MPKVGFDDQHAALSLSELADTDLGQRHPGILGNHARQQDTGHVVIHIQGCTHRTPVAHDPTHWYYPLQLPFFALRSGRFLIDERSTMQGLP